MVCPNAIGVMCFLCKLSGYLVVSCSLFVFVVFGVVCLMLDVDTPQLSPCSNREASNARLVLVVRSWKGYFLLGFLRAKRVCPRVKSGALQILRAKIDDLPRPGMMIMSRTHVNLLQYVQYHYFTLVLSTVQYSGPVPVTQSSASVT